MKVRVRWRATDAYDSTINVDEAVIREWLKESGEPDATVSAALVQEYLEAGDSSEWTDQADESRDYLGRDDVCLEEVSIL